MTRTRLSYAAGQHLIQHGRSHNIAAQIRLLLVWFTVLQDAVAAISDSSVLGRISQIITYLRETGSGKGSKKVERDSSFIRNILAGVNPTAAGQQQVTASTGAQQQGVAAAAAAAAAEQRPFCCASANAIPAAGSLWRTRNRACLVLGALLLSLGTSVA